MIATFGRTKEKELWFPVLSRHGYTHLALSDNELDHKNAIDAVGRDHEQKIKHFALRSRSPSYYTATAMRIYKQEFTIRYSRPSGQPTEWQKLFEMDLDVKPNLFCYGWLDKAHSKLEDYFILNIEVLRQLYDKGHLDRYREMRIKNTDERGSISVIVSLRDLCKLDDAEGLIVHISKGHPLKLGTHKNEPDLLGLLGSSARQRELNLLKKAAKNNGVLYVDSFTIGMACPVNLYAL